MKKSRLKVYLSRKDDATIAQGRSTREPGYQRFHIDKIEGARSVFASREWTVGDTLNGEEADRLSSMNTTIFSA